MRELTPEQYAEQLKRDVEATFLTDQGKRTLEFLEKICHYNLPTLSRGNDGVDNLTNTLINDGKREVILTIKTIMIWPPSKIAEELINQNTPEGV